MDKITISAEVFEDIPEIKTNYTKVVDVLNEHKDGLTNHEISLITGILERRVREATARLKTEDKLKEKPCRCGRTPIYYFYK